MPVEVIKRNLDGMASVKLNVFHWHLSEDQGFRVESKRFPKLQEMGSDGQYYTQDQVREIIAYARDRGIRVRSGIRHAGTCHRLVCRISGAGQRAGPLLDHPQMGRLRSGDGPGQRGATNSSMLSSEKWRRYFPMSTFTSAATRGTANSGTPIRSIWPSCRSMDMADDRELQTYFSQRVRDSGAKHGKKMVGWDEVFHPGVPKDIVVQSWRGQESLGGGARQGYTGILSTGYYLDLMRSRRRALSVDPMPAEQRRS